MMFEKRANDVAASSADKFVVSPRSIITRVNASTFGVWIPNWPAASATAAICSCDAGSSFARPRKPSCNSESSFALPSTVFVTPAHADSQSTAAFTARPVAASATAPAAMSVPPT